MSATLVDELGQPVAGRTIVFKLGAQQVSAATSASGVASATIKLNQQKGSYPLSATFTEDGKYLGSVNNQTFLIGN